MEGDANEEDENGDNDDDDEEEENEAESGADSGDEEAQERGEAEEDLSEPEENEEESLRGLIKSQSVTVAGLGKVSLTLVPMDNRELSHETFLGHGRQPEMRCFLFNLS